MGPRVAALALFVCIAIFILVDGKKRRIKPFFISLFLIFSLLVPYAVLIVLPLYLVARHLPMLKAEGAQNGRHDVSSLCPRCGKSNPRNQLTCKGCGNKLAI